ncbi:hypothetical protein P7_145 [Pectobacterium phage vB_PcaM_P7_Pc]|nr:hypothetical protein P7_145 [Pectobacterium phage vB_PcaM_P7_Pc]
MSRQSRSPVHVEIITQPATRSSIFTNLYKTNSRRATGDYSRRCPPAIITQVYRRW